MYSNLVKYVPNRKPPMGAVLNPYLPINRGLVFYPVMWEGAGDTIEDLSGNGRHATAVGATSEITWQVGPEGSIVDFVGDTRAAFQFNAITFAETDPWTIIFKCQVDGDANESIVLGTYTTTTNYIWPREGLSLRFTNSAGVQANFGKTAFTLWATYAFVAKGDGNLHLYINGVFFQTIAIATSFVLDSIGSAYPNDLYAFDGRVSFVSAYRRDLIASEIALLSQEPFRGFRWPNIIELASYIAAAGGSMPIVMQQHNQFNGGMVA